MSATRKTLVFCGVAVVLIVLAVITAPKKITPNAFLDQGEPFFPEFTDPNVARTLEVIDYDEATGTASPFKVTYENGRWTIPSHNDYPADAKDRLAKTAAGVIEIKKDDFRSDNVADHEACGVIDPLDENALSLGGRGQRITIRGENDVVLADFILGNKVEGRENMRFVRVPDQKRVYAANIDLDLSTKFSDWIETDLLEANKDAFDNLTIKEYSINERTGKVNEGGVMALVKEQDWTMPGMREDEEIDKSKMNAILSALDELKIEDVRPKPAGLTASLTRSADSLTINTADLLSLQDKGFFFSRDGRLLSNEGEMQARTKDGLVYTLRFGEVAYGTGATETAGGESASGETEAAGLNRYLFLTASFEKSLFPEPAYPETTEFLNKADSLWTDADRANKNMYDAHQQWRSKVDKGMSEATRLNARFANWYYVISEDSFAKLRPPRSELIKPKKS